MHPKLCRLIAVLSCGMMMVTSGCGGNGVQLGDVSGVITFDGQPLQAAQITFIPVGPGRQSDGFTDSNGRYRLGYSMSEMGALVGKHVVRVSTAVVDESSDGMIRTAKERIPAKFNTETTLEAEVTRGKNEINFTITSG